MMLNYRLHARGLISQKILGLWTPSRYVGVEKSKERKKVYDELNQKGVMLESGIWGQIPNWESQNIINQFREKTLL